MEYVLAPFLPPPPILLSRPRPDTELDLQGFITQKPTGNSYGVWAAYPDIGDCSKFSKLGFYFEMNDVSHDSGVACDGEGCLYKKKDPGAVDRLEINAYNDKKSHYSEFVLCFEGHLRTDAWGKQPGTRTARTTSSISTTMLLAPACPPPTLAALPAPRRTLTPFSTSPRPT